MYTQLNSPNGEILRLESIGDHVKCTMYEHGIALRQQQGKPISFVNDVSFDIDTEPGEKVRDAMFRAAPDEATR